MRLVISACDAAAAHHLSQVIKEAMVDRRFDVHVVAQNPAADILRKNGLRPTEIKLQRAKRPDSPAGEALLDAARRVVADVKPDAVLCGLSTPLDGGLDEALLAVCDCTSYLLQDFWGEQNAFFGSAPDVLFVLDDMAARSTKERCPGRPVVIGSTRHSNYRTLSFERLREDVRAALAVSSDAKLVGLFGQALHHIPGYGRTVEAWCLALLAMECTPEALYRPHPRESRQEVARTQELFKTLGVSVKTVSSTVAVEQTIAACDVVCATFSNCLYDAAFVNRFASTPLVTPMTLMFDPDLVTYFDEKIKVKHLPYLQEELAYPVASSRELPADLDKALQYETKERFWRSAREKLPDSGLAISNLLDVVAKEYGQ